MALAEKRQFHLSGSLEAVKFKLTETNSSLRYANMHIRTLTKALTESFAAVQTQRMYNSILSRRSSQDELIIQRVFIIAEVLFDLIQVWTKCQHWMNGYRSNIQDLKDRLKDAVSASPDAIAVLESFDPEIKDLDEKLLVEQMQLLNSRVVIADDLVERLAIIERAERMSLDSELFKRIQKIEKEVYLCPFDHHVNC